MPNISQQKKQKISEQILYYLFSVSPQALFTAQIAREIARDEEFTKFLLEELKSKDIIVKVTKNKEGVDYLRRHRWRLSNQVYEAYKKHQPQI